MSIMEGKAVKTLGQVNVTQNSESGFLGIAGTLTSIQTITSMFIIHLVTLTKFLALS